MSYSINDFNKIRQEKTILPVLEALERGFVKFGIDFYLICSVAREVWMRGVNDITPRRATGDIDFAVLIKNGVQYQTLKDYLIATEGFSAYHGNAFVLMAPDGLEIDLLPFGEIEKEGRVNIKGTGMTSIQVDGMQEVYRAGVPEVTFEEKITFKVCTLPGIVLLKLIAWDDRPEIRRDDLTDIADIIFHFFVMYEERIWTEHSDLFDDDKELIVISARVLGREMGKILRRNEQVKGRILNLLPTNGPAKSSKIAIVIAETLDKTTDEISALLAEIEMGIQESST
jgi:predicted nucleotidyltransferase